ncbi:MAG TPA: hypothetical protein VJX67_22780 [Blastocatellia bacterium]|nr:hypothetical protein [Blastocatellia bacterium]
MKYRTRKIVAFLASFTMLSFLSLNGELAFAGLNGGLPQASPIVGSLDGSGNVYVNGRKAVAGASVFSGNVISTGSDGIATLDLRQFGRIILRPSTTVTLSIVGNSAQVAIQGKQVLVAVMSGSANVVAPAGNRNLGVSQQASFAGPMQVTVAPGSVVVLHDQGTHDNKGATATTAGAATGPHTFNPPWWGYLALGGVAGGIAAGIATHGGNGAHAAGKVSTVVP